jgi:hypothetical protein
LKRFELLALVTGTVVAAGTVSVPISTACKALVALLATFLDLGALGAVLASLAQLACVCLAVWRLNRRGLLTPEVPAALGAVSFHLLLPCFMASRLVPALAAAPPGSGLALLPVLAAAQVLVGGLLGALLWALVDGSLRAGLTTRWERITQPWHGATRPAPAAEAIAGTLALATGVPALAAAVLPSRLAAQPPGAQQHGSYGPHAWRLVVAACAFGNSVTLPLLLLGTQLAPPDAAHITGLCALFMAGWSPLLWSIAWRLLAPDGCDTSPVVRPAGDAPSQPAAAAAWPASPVTPKPLLTGSPPGAPPLGAAALRYRVRVASRALADAAERALAATRRTLNPPLVGACVGLILGASPLRKLALEGVAGHHPPEIAILAAALHTLLHAASLLATAVVPVGTLVLASALTADLRPDVAAPRPVSVDTSDVSGALTRGGLAAEAVIGTVRLALMPALTLLVGSWLDAAGWLPHDPLARLLLCTQACMPSAQNLVLLLTLRRGTAAAAPVVAQALVRQYLVAMLPCAFWMATFTRMLL